MATHSHHVDAVYELVAVNELPVVDATKSVKSVLLSASTLRLYKQLNKRIKHVSTFFYILAFPIGAAVLVVATEHARILSLFKFSFQIPMLILLTASLRVDILRCLAVTYEFWFFTMLNALTSTLFAFHFSDLRVFMAPVYWWGIQLCVCVDAKIQDQRVVGASTLAALYHIYLLAVFGLHLTPDAHEFELFRNRKYTMNTDDVLLNAYPTMMLLMARTAYRQRKSQTKEGPDQIVVRLSSFRCRVKLCEKVPATERARARRLRPNRHSDPGSSLYLVPNGDATRETVLQRLRLVKSDDSYSAHDVVAPALLELLLSHNAWRIPRLAGAVGCTGFALNVAAFGCSYYWNKEELHSSEFWTLSLASLLCSLLFCVSMAGLYQRQLLQRLVTSFDFVFITLQNTLTYASICDLLFWDPRCVTILTGWIWLVWLLTLDALTPAVCSLIGFRAKCAVPVLLFAIGVQTVVVVHIVLGNTTSLQDRVLWSVSVLGHTMHLRAVPFFLGRVVTLVLWSLRVLWCMCTSGSGDLILIQGVLEFFGNPKAIRRRLTLTRRPTLMRRAVQRVSLLVRVSRKTSGGGSFPWHRSARVMPSDS